MLSESLVLEPTEAEDFLFGAFAAALGRSRSPSKLFAKEQTLVVGLEAISIADEPFGRRRFIRPGQQIV